MKRNIAINGFGRIGRLSFRELLKKDNVKVVAVNDLTSVHTLAHLLKYDSAHGKFDRKFTASEDGFDIEGYGFVKVLAVRNPAELPWTEMNVDIVLESTGIFRSRETASKHLEAGAEKVIISAPAKGGDVKTIVLGVNDFELTASDDVISNASCTTNCLAPMLKVVEAKFGIDRGFITTIHAYTSDQNIQDAPHGDLRRARAAAQSIIPTSTGAAKAVGLVMPKLKGKLDGMAMRVPVINGSATDVTLWLNRDVTVEDINKAMEEAANNDLAGIMEYSDEPLVSVDIMSSQYSCVFDSGLTYANGRMVKFMGWYDNEYGYSSRCADLIDMMVELVERPASE